MLLCSIKDLIQGCICVFCNRNLELLSSLITGEPAHASLCPFLIILLVIKTCWQAKLLSWVGASLINLSSFPGHIMQFSLSLMQTESLTLDFRSHQGSSHILWIHCKYSIVSAVRYYKLFYREGKTKLLSCNDKLITKQTPNLIWNIVPVLHVSEVNSGLLYYLSKLYNDVPLVEVYLFLLSGELGGEWKNEDRSVESRHRGW